MHTTTAELHTRRDLHTAFMYLKALATLHVESGIDLDLHTRHACVARQGDEGVDTIVQHRLLLQNGHVLDEVDFRLLILEALSKPGQRCLLVDHREQ